MIPAVKSCCNVRRSLVGHKAQGTFSLHPPPAASQRLGLVSGSGTAVSHRSLARQKPPVLVCVCGGGVLGAWDRSEGRVPQQMSSLALL